MKRCGTCGAVLDDHVAFCNTCGSSVAANYPAYRRQPAKEPVSVGGWIGRSLIPCIPLVGGIVYLIMLFIWSGDTKKEESFRNWAKAQLILTAVAIVVMIVLGVVFGAAFSDMLSSL